MLVAKDRPPDDAAASCRPVTVALPSRINRNPRQYAEKRLFVSSGLRTLLSAQKFQPPYFQRLPHSLKVARSRTQAFPIASALFVRSFAQERKSTPLVSSTCALFCGNVGVGRTVICYVLRRSRTSCSPITSHAKEVSVESESSICGIPALCGARTWNRPGAGSAAGSHG